MTETRNDQKKQAEIEILKEDLAVLDFHTKKAKTMECRIALLKLTELVKKDIKGLRRK